MQRPLSCADLFRTLPAAEQIRRVNELTDAEAQALQHDWSWHGRPEQQIPEGDWITWLILAGRGFGKTRTGAETVRQWIRNNKYVNLIGATADDARDIMVECEALALDTPIPTPSGWSDLGDLAVGDEVFAGDGTVTKIIAVSPIWKDRKIVLVLQLRLMVQRQSSLMLAPYRLDLVKFLAQLSQHWCRLFCRKFSRSDGESAVACFSTTYSRRIISTASCAIAGADFSASTIFLLAWAQHPARVISLPATTPYIRRMHQPAEPAGNP
jgi:hypothetical protein